MRTPPDEYDQLERDLRALLPKLRIYAEKFASLLPHATEPLELVTQAVESLLVSRDAPLGDIRLLERWLKQKIMQGAKDHRRSCKRRDAIFSREVQLSLGDSQGVDAPDDDRIQSGQVLPGCSTASHEWAKNPEEQILARERQKLSDEVMMQLLERAENLKTPLTYRVLEHYIAGEKRKDAAKNLGISCTAYDTELQRIRRLLPGVLQDHPHLIGQWEELSHDQE